MPVRFWGLSEWIYFTPEVARKASRRRDENTSKVSLLGTDNPS